MPETSYAGRVDRIDREEISGWIVDRAAPDSPPVVAVYINGTKVGVARQAGIRQDAVTAGFPGARAFLFEPGLSLIPGKNRIEVWVDGKNLVLPNGRGEIEISLDERVESFWEQRYRDQTQLVLRWWQCDHIVRRINKRICGEAIAGGSEGFHRLALRRFASQIPFGSAISIGCGEAHKEIAALQCGLVKSFVAYELSHVALDRARLAAHEAGMTERIEFRQADGLKENLEGQFDAVYWNNSLHHMYNAEEAVAWSWRALKEGGVFLMDDFVGPTRMQWSDHLMQMNFEMRQSLPAEYLRNPHDPGQQLPNTPLRLTVEHMIELDPSECADSGNILPAVEAYFPMAEVCLTGGGIYHLGLNDVLHNIVEAQDFAQLDKLMDLDDRCVDLGETHYAVVLAVKERGSLISRIRRKLFHMQARASRPGE